MFKLAAGTAAMLRRFAPNLKTRKSTYGGAAPVTPT